MVVHVDSEHHTEPSNRGRVSSYDAWQAFETVVEFFANILTSASQLTVIMHASRMSGGPIFALLCVARPLLKTISYQSIWSRSRFWHHWYPTTF